MNNHHKNTFTHINIFLDTTDPIKLERDIK